MLTAIPSSENAYESICMSTKLYAFYLFIYTEPQ